MEIILDLLDTKGSNLDQCTRSLQEHTLVTRTLATLLGTRHICLTMLQVYLNSMQPGTWALVNLY